MEFFRPKTTHIIKKGRRNTALHNKEEVQNLVMSLVLAQRHARYKGCGGVQFICRVPHAPRTRLTQMGVRFGTALLRESTIVHSTACQSRSSSCRFQFHAAFFLRSSLLKRPWRCGFDLNHTLISPNPSSCRPRSTPRLRSNAYASSAPSIRRK